MARYPVSGSNLQDIEPATSTAATGGLVTLYTITSGRVFWLRGAYIVPNASTGPLDVYDTTQASGATTPTATTRKLMLGMQEAASGQALAYSFSSPGIRFANNPKALLDASSSVTAGGVTIWGYEE